MKISLISPTSLIKEYGNKGDFHLTLAHLLGPVDEEPNEYEKTIVESGLPIYLDNGLFENHKSVPLEELIKKAAHLNAEYVFAPDVLFDKTGTEANIGPAYDLLMELKEDFPENQTKLAAVVQGQTADEYLDSYQTMVGDPRVSLIGLSILSIPKCFGPEMGTEDIVETRIEALRLLNQLPAQKVSHLLGAGSSYRDVAFAAEKCPWVISHDSSSAIWNGVDLRPILPDLSVKGGKSPKSVDFNFNEELSNEQHAIIKSNIDTVLKVVHQ